MGNKTLNSFDGESDDKGEDELDDFSYEEGKPKPKCQYGANCYRKHPDHLKKFSHPKKEEIFIEKKGK